MVVSRLNSEPEVQSTTVRTRVQGVGPFNIHTDEGLMAATDHHIARTAEDATYADRVGAMQEKLMRSGMGLEPAFVAAVNAAG